MTYDLRQSSVFIYCLWWDGYWWVPSPTISLPSPVMSAPVRHQGTLILLATSSKGLKSCHQGQLSFHVEIKAIIRDQTYVRSRGAFNTITDGARLCWGVSGESRGEVGWLMEILRRLFPSWRIIFSSRLYPVVIYHASSISSNEVKISCCGKQEDVVGSKVNRK